MKRELNQWRTISVAVWGISALLWGLAITSTHPAAASVYPSFVGGVGAVVAAVAVKAWGQHKAEASVKLAVEESK